MSSVIKPSSLKLFETIIMKGCMTKCNTICMLSCWCKLVKRSIPVFPNRFSSQWFQCTFHFYGRALIAYMELLQGLRISVVSSRFEPLLSALMVVTQVPLCCRGWCRFAGRVGDIHIVVEDAHGKSKPVHGRSWWHSAWKPPFSAGRMLWKLTLYFGFPTLFWR